MYDAVEFSGLTVRIIFTIIILLWSKFAGKPVGIEGGAQHEKNVPAECTLA